MTKNLSENGENDTTSYAEFSKKLKDDSGTEYQKSLVEVLNGVRQNPIPSDAAQYNTAAVDALDDYISAVMSDAANPNWKNENSNSEGIYNTKQFNFINEKIVQPLKSDLENLQLEVQKNQDSEESEKNGDESSESKTGTSNFKGTKDLGEATMNMSEMSKGTKDLLAELDVMNPVVEKSMKILENIDVDKLENLLNKFGNIDPSNFKD